MAIGRHPAHIVSHPGQFLIGGAKARPVAAALPLSNSLPGDGV